MPRGIFLGKSYPSWSSSVPLENPRLEIRANYIFKGLIGRIKWYLTKTRCHQKITGGAAFLLGGRGEQRDCGDLKLKTGCLV